jgi:hypothetical protein
MSDRAAPARKDDDEKAEKARQEKALLDQHRRRLALEDYFERHGVSADSRDFKGI